MYKDFRIQAKEKEKEEFTFTDLQTEAKKWTQHNFPNAKPYQPLLGIIEEVGELAHAHLKAEQGIRDPKIESKVDAIADAIVFMAHYCTLNNIDLQSAIYETWQEVKKRDWVKFPVNGINK